MRLSPYIRFKTVDFHFAELQSQAHKNPLLDIFSKVKIEPLKLAG
jgi:hypothetical protein